MESKFQWLQEDFEDYNVVEFKITLTSSQITLFKLIGGYSSIDNIWNFPNKVDSTDIINILNND